jgi:23S rRNA pseudouridine2605 synthase
MTENKRHSASGSTGLARALSKLGFCSRSQGRQFIRSGKVRLNGKPCRDPERRVDLKHDRIEIDSQIVRPANKVYLMLNKPRGLVTTVADEQGRPTVFECLAGAQLPALAPVGRLDKASEGLLLFTNDTAWAAGITAPHAGLEKIYHVQVDCLSEAGLIERMKHGLTVEGDFLRAKRVSLLRCGSRNSWLEVVLTEGKNRHIRRLLEALGVSVVRLVRVAVGPLQLGGLAKGAFRHLTADEVRAFALSERASKGNYFVTAESGD